MPTVFIFISAGRLRPRDRPRTTPLPGVSGRKAKGWQEFLMEEHQRDPSFQTIWRSMPSQTSASAAERSSLRTMRRIFSSFTSARFPR